jgi:hypothetical protein
MHTRTQKCVLAFCCCDKIPERNQLKGEKVYFGLKFQSGVLTWLVLDLCEAMHHGGSIWQSKVAHLMVARRKRADFL